jgi:hypothetical protein
MLYYERVRNEDKPSLSVWSSHSRATTTTTNDDDDNDDNDDDLGEIDDGDDGGQENARTHRSQHRLQPDVVKCEPGLEVGDDEMEEEVPVIKARVVRSVSLGAGDDFDGASVSVKHEVEVEKRERERDGGPDSELRLSRPRPSSPTPAKPERVESPSLSTEAPSHMPEAPVVDEPPIGAIPQSVDLRA